MTDNEIIKALECCITTNDNCFCCELFEACIFDPGDIRRKALDLINRQKAEVEGLQTEKDNLIKTYKECAFEIVKEFAERLKERWTIASPEPYTTDVAEVLDSIDNILKEMGGLRGDD